MQPAKGRKLTDELTSTSRAAAATAASGDAAAAVRRRRRTGAAVDRIQRVVDRHVHHRVHPGLVQRVAGRRNAGSEGRLTGIGIPGQDGISSRSHLQDGSSIRRPSNGGEHRHSGGHD